MTPWASIPSPLTGKTSFPQRVGKTGPTWPTPLPATFPGRSGQVDEPVLKPRWRTSADSGNQFRSDRPGAVSMGGFETAARHAWPSRERQCAWGTSMHGRARGKTGLGDCGGRPFGDGNKGRSFGHLDLGSIFWQNQHKGEVLRCPSRES